MYITYDEYIEMGGTAEQSSFSQLELLARKKLDYWTQNRITDPDEDVKLCMTIIINAIYDIESGDQDVSSFSNDGVSVTLADAKTSEQKMQDAYRQVVEILPVDIVSVVIE